MKHMRIFNDIAEYQAFTGGGEYITPNVCLISGSKDVYCKPKIKSAPVLITFTVAGIEYQALEGMSWEEWCNSEYNTHEFWCELNNVRIDHGSTIYGETPSNVICGGNAYSSVGYLTILALEDGLQAKLSGNTVSYSLDEGNTWTSLASNKYTPTVNSGQTIMFKGNLMPNSTIGTFTISKNCNLEGNCMSLLFGDDTVNNNSLSGKSYAFYKLFYNCSTIIQVSKSFLPATTLASNCYQYMFYGCSYLTVAPELPATILASDCYRYMFNGCTSLTVAPELPATTLADSCYASMFSGCKSLTTAPELPATTLANYCYYYMFYDCTNLTTAPELPATTLTRNCYYHMFQGCKSLTTAPELLATTLVISCYDSMFYGCSNLNYIKMLATNISASDCLYNWVSGVASTGTFIKNPDMTSLPNGISGIPDGWGVYNNGEKIGGGNISTNITFPVHLVAGDNGQLGVDLYNYLIEKYCPGVLNNPNYNVNIVLDASDELYITRNSVTGEVDSIQWSKTYQKFLIYARNVSAYEFVFSKDGYLINEQSGGGSSD